MIQLDLLAALQEIDPPTPAWRLKHSLGPRPAEVRFWEKVDKSAPGGCWVWLASTFANGYGQFSVLGQVFKAHRWAYQALVGPIPEGKQLDHLCHTHDASCAGGDSCRHRRCVNPAHLEPVTARVNTLRGDTLPAFNAAKTECKWSHPFDAGNTRYTKRGARVCRTCHANDTAKRRARLRAQRTT